MSISDKEHKRLLEKVEMYEGFLHDINLYVTSMNNEKIGRLVQNANSWSYAHRVGNGVYSEEEQQKIVDSRFKELREQGE